MKEEVVEAWEKGLDKLSEWDVLVGKDHEGTPFLHLKRPEKEVDEVLKIPLRSEQAKTLLVDAVFSAGYPPFPEAIRMMASALEAFCNGLYEGGSGGFKRWDEDRDQRPEVKAEAETRPLPVRGE